MVRSGKSTVGGKSRAKLEKKIDYSAIRAAHIANGKDMQCDIRDGMSYVNFAFGKLRGGSRFRDL